MLCCCLRILLIALLEQKLRKHLDKKHDVVISDVRHPKEFKLVEEYDGFPVRVFKRNG